MDQTVQYAINPTKTAWEGKKTEEADMTANIAYALNPAKGTTKLYQTAINLDSPETAWKEMRATKERWGKMDGILGFHVVQSFRPGEIEPELAHKVGVEFVERCFPGYEAVIGTHLDKHHIHNHIVLNSVSCLDGHKYHSTQKSYYHELRKVSDELCRKHGLSVVEPHAEGTKAKSHAEWQADRQGQPTWCSAIREDVDAAIVRSLTFEQFVRQLREIGYEVKTGVKHMVVRPPGKERFTRLRRLGDDYTEAALCQRILQNDPSMPSAKESTLCQMAQSEREPPSVRRGRYQGTWPNPQRKKVKGLRALYLWYAYRMGNVRSGGNSSRKTHYLLREDIRKLQKRDRMAALLIGNRIETYEQLHAHRDECREMISFLCERRAELKKQAPCASVEADLSDIRMKLKVLRQEVRLCEDIETDSRALEKKRVALRRLEHEKPQRGEWRTPVQNDRQPI
jgi:hypothetical protein